MKRYLSRLLAGASGVAGLLVITAVPAFATQPNDAWSTNATVGRCAQVSGGYVLAAQNFLWADQGYKPDDDHWGTNSANALIAFQTQYGIAHDGCAGTNTWNAMRGYVTSRCSPGYVCNVPNNQVSIAGRLAYYERTNCDWGTYVASGLQGGPTQAGGDYSFSSSLGPVVSCA